MVWVSDCSVVGVSDRLTQLQELSGGLHCDPLLQDQCWCKVLNSELCVYSVHSGLQC